MSLRFKNRIALFNTVAAAITTLVVFLIVYFVVFITAYRQLDSDIQIEKKEVDANIQINGDSLNLDKMFAWQERELQQADVSPTFLQVVNAKGTLIFRSANLQNDHLVFAQPLTKEMFFNITLNGEQIRQGLFPLYNDKGKMIGQLDIGLPQVESSHILSNLRLTLYIMFPLMLLIFFLASSWAASGGITPVNQLIRATETISGSDLSKRIPLPAHKDEIHQLATTINEFLRRIEVSLSREKQITADISHEMRTPITIIRGTLEVLIRKKREPAQYEEKIRQVISEVDSLNNIIDQLLELARLEAGNLTITRSNVELCSVLYSIKERWCQRLAEKQILLLIMVPENIEVNSDQGFLLIILDNLISNAIKHSNNGQSITCSWNIRKNSLSIHDNGPGIPGDQIMYLFNRFYRTDISRSSRIQGMGLGLSIVKTLTDLLGISIDVKSKLGEGATFTLKFNDRDIIKT